MRNSTTSLRNPPAWDIWQGETCAETCRYFNLQPKISDVHNLCDQQLQPGAGSSLDKVGLASATDKLIAFLCHSLSAMWRMPTTRSRTGNAATGTS